MAPKDALRVALYRIKTLIGERGMATTGDTRIEQGQSLAG